MDTAFGNIEYCTCCALGETEQRCLRGTDLILQLFRVNLGNMPKFANEHAFFFFLSIFITAALS